MKQILQKANQVRFFIGFVLIVLLVLWSIQTYKGVIDFKLIHYKELTFGLWLKLMYYSGNFVNPLVIILACIGFFISNPIGWTLTNNVFAYFFVVFCFIIMPADNMAWYYYLLGLIPIGFIVLMNRGKIVAFYNIKKANSMIYNLAAILLGMAFAFLWGYFMVNPGKSCLDIICAQQTP